MVSITSFQYVLAGLEEMKGVWQRERRVLESLVAPKELEFDLDSTLRVEVKRLKRDAHVVVSILRET
jgi:hypothetical protein